MPVAASLLVITGPPGAGKSAVAEAVADRFERSVLVTGDSFFAFVRQGYVMPWLPESHAQNTTVTHAAGAAAGRYVEGGYPTVYDGVIGPWFVDEFLDARGLASLDYVVLLPSVERCVEHVASRVGHGFTDEAATRKMHAQFSAASLDARHVLDPPVGVERTADAVLAMVATETTTITTR